MLRRVRVSKVVSRIDVSKLKTIPDPQMTTRERTEKVAPLEKFDVLAVDIDLLRQRIEGLQSGQSMDSLLEVVEVEKLASRFGVSADAMRKRLTSVGGHVFKMGRQFVIRKVSLLQALENLEQRAVGKD